MSLQVLPMLIFEENGAIWRVHDFEETLKNGERFYKNNMYIIKSDLRNMVLPYRGEVKSFRILFSQDTLPGIYFNEKTGKYNIRGPRTKKEKDHYSVENVMNLRDKKYRNKFGDDSFMDMHLEHKASGDIFAPDIDDEDDFTTKTIKAFIGSKQISFGDYGPRLESLAAVKGDGSTGNARNNSKRALMTNHSTSASKLVYYLEAFDGEIALVVRDKPNCPNPAFNPGEQMVIYPMSEPFTIENLTPIQSVIERNRPGYKSEDSEELEPEVDDDQDE